MCRSGEVARTAREDVARGYVRIRHSGGHRSLFIVFVPPSTPFRRPARDAVFFGRLHDGLTGRAGGDGGRRRAALDLA